MTWQRERRGGVPQVPPPESLLAGGLPGNLERTIVSGALEHRPSFPGLLGQARIYGAWREVEWQKASVLELVILSEKKV